MASRVSGGVCNPWMRGAGSAVRVSSADTAVVRCCRLPTPPDSSGTGRNHCNPRASLQQLILSSPPSHHKGPFTLSTRHALPWSLPQMAYILLGHLMMRFYFITYISAAAHKSLHSGSNGLSFSCHYSLKRALNQLHKGCDLK